MKWLFPIIVVLIFMGFAIAHASNINLKVCKEKNYDCQTYILFDVKKIEKISNGNILRITFMYNNHLDIDVSDKYYEIKK